MRVLYLLAASDAARALRRRLPGILAWAAFAALMLAPFACAFLLGRATAP